MKKDNKFTTRTHLEERNWLVNLGNGNLIEGVKILIERAKGERSGQKHYKRKK